jgi:predicted ribosomally synthesized peptide with SipW-like signal peptide
MSRDIDPSRRKALAALGSIGVASAGAGLGTGAYFSDQETFENNRLVAGTLDMKVAATNWYSDWSADEGEHIDMVDPSNAQFVLPAPRGLDGARDIAFSLDDEEGQEFLNDTATRRVNGGVYAR